MGGVGVKGRELKILHRILGPGLPPGPGARKTVLCRMVPKDKSQNSFIFGVEVASGLQETHQERWGAKPPTFLVVFPGARRPF